MTARGSAPAVSLTGRALVLGAVVVLLALVLASPLQRYLRQRDSLAQARHQEIAESAEVARLGQLKAKWADPAYIEQQARARLQFARPGDTVYVVIDPKHATANASADQTQPATSDAGQTTWQTKAWTSLQVADIRR
jgi:cell division protein FtsB